MTDEFVHYKFIAEKGQSPLRVDKFLMNFIENASRNKIQKAADLGNIYVNGNIVRSSYKVKSDDIVKIIYDYPKREIELIPQNIPLNIEYEDDDIIIIHKEAGIVVHPGYGNYEGTLANALAFHFNNLPNIGDETRPGIVHRLDKLTSGIIVIAKNEVSMSVMSRKFSERNLDRRYLALVWGDVKEDSGKIDANIGRSLKNRKVMNVFPNSEYGKRAITHYKVIERFRYTTLIECKLETGRTHQIRVHLKYLGHPVFNDPEYGGDKILKGTTFSKYKKFVVNCFKICNRQALHAKSLSFQHPITNKKLDFFSDLPKDMSLLIERWRKYVN